MIKKEWLLLGVSTVLTVFIALSLLRWLAPQLLGIPVDLRMVKVSKEVPPFFDGVFREEDYNSKEWIISDPFVMRGKPLIPDGEFYGPNDILGFRNRFIPNVADLICIGDSQTYGNNSSLEHNWPNQLTEMLAEHSQAVQYSMAVGGWSAVEYLEIFKKALLFRPRVVVIAFYTGNDPLESFTRTYSNPRWGYLRPDKSLSADKIPSMLSDQEFWEVKFKNGFKTVFTPQIRFLSNQDHPAVHAGYDIMAQTAKKIIELTEDANKIFSSEGWKMQTIFTIIPTKELVYAPLVQTEQLESPPVYKSLVEAERRNIEKLAGELKNLPGAIYVDIVTPLQKTASVGIPLYLDNDNSHPIPPGYNVIAATLALIVQEYLPRRPAIAVSPENRLLLIKNNKMWHFATPEIAEANGWKAKQIIKATPRDLANLPWMGTIKIVDHAQWGPSEIN